ncbi:MAG: hypothetical protein C4536_02510 [Actinobacteria bacterium]|jgi:hypothetical protein|nr:MAG: hypothetical protein C4536_02510 [Actinomycetota bacterium]
MIEVKGKFITLAGSLMSLYPEQRDKADAVLFRRTGKHWNELDPDSFYDTDVYKVFLDAYCEGSITGEKALITLGLNYFPTIKKLGGIPDGIKDELDLIIFSTRSFADDHKGPGIRPIRVIKAEDGDVVLDIPDCGYDCRLGEGVYLGILGMYGIDGGRVEQERCIRKGSSTCEFHITW